MTIVHIVCLGHLAMAANAGVSLTLMAKLSAKLDSMIASYIMILGFMKVAFVGDYI